MKHSTTVVVVSVKPLTIGAMTILMTPISATVPSNRLTDTAQMSGFQEAMAFIERQVEGSQNSPFFCYLSTNAPHGPFRVPDAYSEVYRRKGVQGDRAKLLRYDNQY